MRLSYLQSIPREDNPTQDETISSVAEYIALLNVKIKSLKATIQGEIGKINTTQKQSNLA
jgi:hypothetical protein